MNAPQDIMIIMDMNANLANMDVNNALHQQTALYAILDIVLLMVTAKNANLDAVNAMMEYIIVKNAAMDFIHHLQMEIMFNAIHAHPTVRHARIISKEGLFVMNAKMDTFWKMGDAQNAMLHVKLVHQQINALLVLMVICMMEFHAVQNAQIIALHVKALHHIAHHAFQDILYIKTNAELAIVIVINAKWDILVQYAHNVMMVIFLDMANVVNAALHAQHAFNQILLIHASLVLMDTTHQWNTMTILNVVLAAFLTAVHAVAIAQKHHGHNVPKFALNVLMDII